MFKHLLQKLIGSVLHSKKYHRRHSSSHFNRPYGNGYHNRHSSDHHSGYGHQQQGHGYYKNKYGRSS
ncbi:hypothetical protein [Paenibacillus aestuarii]|uniref:Uncharacterized protein n=1 Tax=Paenibacillus aestuarii TaxID=516965 RepID=A0ABW0KAK9_9BACL|nr:hypothetical protein [Paenibacillus aestuarii]